ncbi:MAG TPA: hypothetical protein VF665_18620, partial [Longimicrobium sp.]|uniref:hypothetical protein n=1 Tax=Longimicrobium sp. TaxID=2029185 RepID=UPI002ED90CF3
GPAETREIAALLAALVPAEDPGEPFDGLGYRGMVLAEVGPEVHPCPQLRISAGTVTATCADGRRAYADPGRALERRLVELGRGTLPADVHRILVTVAGLGEQG